MFDTSANEDFTCQEVGNVGFSQPQSTPGRCTRGETLEQPLRLCPSGLVLTYS